MLGRGDDTKHWLLGNWPQLPGVQAMAANKRVQSTWIKIALMEKEKREAPGCDPAGLYPAPRCFNGLQGTQSGRSKHLPSHQHLVYLEWVSWHTASYSSVHVHKCICNKLFFGSSPKLSNNRASTAVGKRGATSTITDQNLRK